jgi:hypothetical protein
VFEHWETGSEGPYRSTHKNHPTAVWVRSSVQNYIWTCNYGKALCREYTYRYGRRHKTEDHIDWLINNRPKLADIDRTPFYQAMPEYCRMEDSILAYRNYYNLEKRHLFSWSKRPVPFWVIQ